MTMMIWVNSLLISVGLVAVVDWAYRKHLARRKAMREIQELEAGLWVAGPPFSFYDTIGNNTFTNCRFAFRIPWWEHLSPWSGPREGAE